MDDKNNNAKQAMPVVNIMMPPKVEKDEIKIDSKESLDDLKINEKGLVNIDMGNLVGNQTSNNNVDNNSNLNNVSSNTTYMEDNKYQQLNNNNNNLNGYSNNANPNIDTVIPQPIVVQNIVPSNVDNQDIEKTIVIPVINNNQEFNQDNIKDSKKKVPLIILLIGLIILGISFLGFVLLNKKDNSSYYVDEIKNFVSKLYIFNNKYDNEKISFSISLIKPNNSSLEEDVVNSLNNISFNGELFFSKNDGFKLLNGNLFDNEEDLGMISFQNNNEEDLIFINNLFDDRTVVKGIDKNLFEFFNSSLYKNKVLEYLDNIGMTMVDTTLDEKDVSLVNLDISSNMLSNIGINYNKDIKVNFYFDNQKIIRIKIFSDIYSVDVNISGNNNFNIYKNDSLLYSGFIINSDKNIVISLNNKYNNNLIISISYNIDMFDSIDNIELNDNDILIDKDDYEVILNKLDENNDFYNLYNYFKNVFYMVQ